MVNEHRRGWLVFWQEMATRRMRTRGAQLNPCVFITNKLLNHRFAHSALSAAKINNNWSTVTSSCAI